MSVGRNEVEKIAELARLRFEDDDIERLMAELNGILEHVEALRSLVPSADDGGPGPATGLASTRPTEDGEPDALGAGPASIAPHWADGFFVVPPPPGVHDADG